MKPITIFSLTGKIRDSRSMEAILYPDMAINITTSESPECLCHHNQESPLHYFLDCFLYLPERQILFDKIEHYIPKFKSLSKQKKLEIVLHGIDN